MNFGVIFETILRKAFFLWAPVALSVLSACGVKSDPQPPMTPVEIGRGKPLYKNEEDTSPLQRKGIPDDEQKNEEDTDEAP